MTGIESPETARTVLGEMSVSVYLLKASHSPAGFSKSSPVGQYNVVMNNKTGKFESYKGSTEKPTFPKIISDAGLRTTSTNVSSKAESKFLMDYARRRLGRTQLQISSVAKKKYLKYYEKKQDYFATCVYEYYKKERKTDNTYTLPNFICFGRRLADALQTPCAQRGMWDFHAAKFGNSIFLWADPNSPQQIQARKLNGKNLGNLGYGYAFEALLTGENLSTLPMDLMSKKPLVVHERTFGNGKHSLLLVSDIDAENDQGKWVELKVYEKHYVQEMESSLNSISRGPSDKALSCWSQCVAAGCSRVIIGKSDQGCLVDITVRDLQQFTHMANITPPHMNLCYDFLDKFLHFVKNQFENNPTECCLQFMWDSKEEVRSRDGVPEQRKHLRKVKCVRALQRELPKWFNELCVKLTLNDNKGSYYMIKAYIVGLDYGYIGWWCLVGVVGCLVCLVCSLVGWE